MALFRKKNKVVSGPSTHLQPQQFGAPLPSPVAGGYQNETWQRRPLPSKFEADYMSKAQLQQPPPKQRRDALGRTGQQRAYDRLMRD